MALDLSRLSDEQRQAVVAPDGPLLILAGPGSGKTTVLAARVVYLVTARGVSPESILLLAFATRAARELRARLVGILGEAATGVDVGTFHAFGLRIIREWQEDLGFGPEPLAVCGQSEARSLLREVAEGQGVDLYRYPLAQLAVSLERYRLDAESDSAELRSLAEGYEALLRRRNLVDYPAMLGLPLRLFREHPGTLRLLQDSYRHLLVDEFQDVCAAQYELARLLAARHRNLVAVGDARQTLYSWRGASARFVEQFRRDFPEVQTLGLDQNFRSTGRIVALANALGEGLPNSRQIWTANPAGTIPILHLADEERTEAEFVASEIARLQSAGVVGHPGEVAVLYRANWQGEEVALALRERRLPYRVLGHAELLGKRVVKDAIAYLRLACNPHDASALARIVNVPPRRLGWLVEERRVQPLSLAELLALAGRHGHVAAESAGRLVSAIAEFEVRRAELSPTALLDLVLERTGYPAWLEARPDGRAGLASLAKLRALLERTKAGIGDWLAELQLGEDAGWDPDDARRVLLTTIHGAKGGEWRAVFVIGFEEGLLPHRRSLVAGPSGVGEWGTDDPPVDQERRVAYVAVTRPREYLYLTGCRRRHRGDRVEPCRPSRFLQSLPLDAAEDTEWAA